MRIATSTILSSGVSQMLTQESSLATLANEVSSGKSVTAPGDDPIAAAQAVETQTSLSQVTQYTANQQVATSALQQEDNTLGSVSTTLQSIQALVLQAGSGALTDQNRQSIAQQLTAARAQLFGLANTTDATGNYIFAGYQTATAPFVNNANGVGASYVGDQGQRLVQVSASAQVAVSDTGSAVFDSVSQGAASNIVSAGASNTGNATVTQLATTNPQSTDLKDGYTVTFAISSDTPPITSYTIEDTTTGLITQQSQPYTAGASIPIGAGQTLTLTGTPAAGDTFSVAAPSTTSSNVFTTLDTLIKTLQQPADTTAAKTSLTNALFTFGTQISNTENNVLTVRASVGAREQQVTALTASTQALSTNDQTRLTSLTSADVALVYTQFQSAQTALEAAQKAFVSIRGLSLFSLINP